MQVSRSGFYAGLTRKPSAQATRDRRLKVLESASFTASKGRYGSPRILRDPRAAKERVIRLMREEGFKARVRRRFRCTTKRDPRLPVAPNHLDRASRPKAQPAAGRRHDRVPGGGGWETLSSRDRAATRGDPESPLRLTCKSMYLTGVQVPDEVFARLKITPAGFSRRLDLFDRAAPLTWNTCFWASPQVRSCSDYTSVRAFSPTTA
jgi:hypothetical protein